MCKYKTKLNAFGYILAKFVAHQLEIQVLQSSNEQLCSSFSNKRIMKLLYLLCLESISIDNKKCGLFEIFDRMIAYPNGPVEQDVYDGLHLIPFTTYKDGHFIKLPNLDECKDYYKADQLEDSIKESIDNAFESLKCTLSNNEFFNRNLLIEKIHNLYLWSETYMFNSYNERQMPVNNFDMIHKEYQRYKGKDNTCTC